MSSEAVARTAGASAPVAERSRFWLLTGGVAVPVLAADQLSKIYISSHFQMYQTVPIVPGWLDLTYTLNPGAAFSLFATMPASFREAFFIVLSAVAIMVLLTLLARRSTAPSSALAFALILGGTIGNLIDRLVRERVVDFIYFHHRSFSYPVFNIADSAITIGVGILLIFGVFAPQPDQPPPAP